MNRRRDASECTRFNVFLIFDFIEYLSEILWLCIRSMQSQLDRLMRVRELIRFKRTSQMIDHPLQTESM